MQSVQSIAEAIVAREGGYVNDPDDPGGATKYGVTIGTMRRLSRDLTGDGVVGLADVKALTREQAVAIFITNYYHAPKIDLLPECLRPTVFDMYVNSGANAVKLLQRLLTRLGHACKDDGGIGPQTIRAAEAAAAEGRALVDLYGMARRDYYYAIADARPASRKYARRRDGGKGGWITRAEEFLPAHLHLTEAAHRARIAHWG